MPSLLWSFGLCLLLLLEGASGLNPVFLIPGIGGSNMWAEIQDAHIPECTKWSLHGKYTRKRHQIWLPFYELLWSDCWSGVLAMDLNSTSGLFENKKGVEVEPFDFGGLGGIAYIGHVTEKRAVKPQFSGVIGELEKRGYQEGRDLFGIPYDFRLAPEQVDWERVKGLAEEAVSLNGGARLIWVAHSYGNLMSTYFFNHIVDQQWKDKHVEVFVSIAAPYGGVFSPVAGIISGDVKMFKVKGHQMVDRKATSKITRNSGSSAYLVPRESFWGSDGFQIKTLTPPPPPPGGIKVKPPKGSPPPPPPPPEEQQVTATYTIANWTLLVPEPAKTNIQTTMRRVPQLRIDEDPGVPSICVWGKGFPVPTEVAWVEGRTDVAPELLRTIDGDGAVSVRSASHCASWKNSRMSLPLAGGEHLKLLRSWGLLEMVGLLAQKGNNSTDEAGENTTALNLPGDAHGQFEQQTFRLNLRGGSMAVP